MKLLKVFKQGIAMELSGEMAYKWNFYTKSFAMLLADFVGPLITTLIYASTAGIPGWSFYEFLLFQGTLIIVFGLGHMIALRVPFEIIHAIREGEFDRFLVKPISPLIYLFATSFVMEGISQTLLGIGIVAFCFFKLGISVFSASFAAYLILIAAAFLIQCAMMTLISACAFLVVRSEALMTLYFKISDFVRYPLNVYSFSLTFFLTFMFPLAVSSFYPAMVLIEGVSLGLMLKALLPVAGFVVVSLFLWNLAMKKYTSAGG